MIDGAKKQVCKHAARYNEFGYNFTLVINVCEATPISLFWAPKGPNKLPEVRFEFPFMLMGLLTMTYLKGLSYRIVKSWYTDGCLEQRFRGCFAAKGLIFDFKKTHTLFKLKSVK